MRQRRQIPITRPTLPELSTIEPQIREIFQTGQLTNGKYVRDFESKFARQFGIAHTVAMSSCTDGLCWVMKYLPAGEIIIPDFTFCATGNATNLAGHKIVLADCRRDTFNLNPEEIEDKINHRTRAIVATYVYGNPPELNALKKLAARHNIKLILDAAHAVGARYRGKYAGTHAWAEVFSLTPTKLLCCGEGGMVATKDKKLADYLRLAREYGNPGDYNTRIIGTNARMTEFNAILGLAGLKHLNSYLKSRNRIAAVYRHGLSEIPGISFPRVDDRDYCSFKDFTILIDPTKAPFTRNELRDHLHSLGVGVRCYFDPPLHRQKAFIDLGCTEGANVPISDYVARNCLSLPMFSHMESSQLSHVIQLIQHFARKRSAPQKSKSGESQNLRDKT